MKTAREILRELALEGCLFGSDNVEVEINKVLSALKKLIKERRPEDEEFSGTEGEMFNFALEKYDEVIDKIFK